MAGMLIKNIGLLATPMGTAAKSGAQQGAVQFLYDAFVISILNVNGLPRR